MISNTFIEQSAYQIIYKLCHVSILILIYTQLFLSCIDHISLELLHTFSMIITRW